MHICTPSASNPSSCADGRQRLCDACQICARPRHIRRLRPLHADTCLENGIRLLCNAAADQEHPRHKFYVTVTNWLRKHRTSGHVLVFRRKPRTMSTSVSVTESRRVTFWIICTQSVAHTFHEVRICDASVTFLVCIVVPYRRPIEIVR